MILEKFHEISYGHVTRRRLLTTITPQLCTKTGDPPSLPHSVNLSKSFAESKRLHKSPWLFEMSQPLVQAKGEEVDERTRPRRRSPVPPGPLSHLTFPRSSTLTPEGVVHFTRLFGRALQKILTTPLMHTYAWRSVANS